MDKINKIKKLITSDALNGLLLLNPMKLKEKSADFKAFFAVGIVSIIWGTTWVVSKQGVSHMPALEMAGIRQLIGGSCFLLFFIIRKYPLPKSEDYIPLVILSVLNFVLSNGLSTWGVKYISSGLASIIGAIFPIWIVLISVFITKAKPPVKTIIGIILGFIGVCTIFYEHLSDFFNSEFRFGILVSLTATWSWAFGTIYTKKHAVSFNPYFGLGFQMALSGIILLLVSSFDSEFLSVTEIPAISWFAIFYLVIFGSIIGFGCYLYALQKLPTEQASIYAYINPIIALIAGWLLLNEPLTLLIWVGGAVSLLGVFLVNRSFVKK